MDHESWRTQHYLNHHYYHYHYSATVSTTCPERYGEDLPVKPPDKCDKPDSYVVFALA